VNLGRGEEIRVAELAGKIAAMTGYRGRIAWDSEKPNGQPRRLLDVTRAAREFGFRAATSLDDGLRETIDWIGWDRILFSTDYPHWDSDDPRYAFKFAMSPERRKALFTDNATKLYGLP